MEPLRVLLADDHPVFRRGLRMLLDAQPEGAEIVGEASNGVEAVELARELQPDVVVMDLQMPELNGIEATQRIVEESPHIGVLVLTMFEDDGGGLATAARAGVGLVSMRERAAELGGTLQVAPRPARGTVVRALLPVNDRSEES